MAKRTAQLASTAGSLLINVASSVGVILVNKRLVFQEAGFRFSTILTLIHFVVTFFGCLLFAALGFFTPKKLPWRRVFPLCCAFCGSIVFNNLSLLTNSVSVYQVSKIACTPFIVFVEARFNARQEKRRTLWALVPVCIGVFLTTYGDTRLTATGFLYAALAVVSNSLYTIWGKTKQDELGAQPLQLLMYQAPMSACMLLFIAPALDGIEPIRAYTFTITTVWTIAVSCCCAFGVNFSFFLFVGKTSPLTMNVVGYFKTVLVFVGEYLFVPGDPATSAKLVGITLTCVGLALYTAFKYNDSTASAGTATRRTVSATQSANANTTSVRIKGAEIV